MRFKFEDILTVNAQQTQSTNIIPKFKTGDRVEYIGPTPGFVPSPWVAIGSHGFITKVTYCIHTSYNYKVYFFSLMREANMIEAELKEVMNVTITGTNPSLGTNDFHLEESKQGWTGVVKLNLDPPKCDCGGFKTYNSMASEHHSSWCSSRNGASNG